MSNNCRRKEQWASFRQSCRSVGTGGIPGTVVGKFEGIDFELDPLHRYRQQPFDKAFVGHDTTGNQRPFTGQKGTTYPLMFLFVE
ncbi:hypothetical protein M413DRAFT_120207 [Hebeloma cylindrosporum]|uniref:Uncharacterized protein n=1 Tax=Hebeloma cylindrosporum TaxID=76867 RepID=A0A0C3CEE6_HEBCY|nr:hypothetical protein M413DRAFT_120207 [Hebeloma cylindrosporum h7]